jgi:hypothetical protein
MVVQPLFWVAMAIAQVGAFYLFKDLADVSQWVLQTPREITMSVWYNRHVIAFTSLLCLAVGLVMWWRFRGPIKGRWVIALSLVFAFHWYSGYINPHVMMRERQHEGVFLSVEEAAKYLDADESVIVIDIDGQARAHSDRQLLRPHVAGNGQLGGENVIMTYCGLTNLGMAFTPEIDGQSVQLSPITQLENNLVMVDKTTGEPVQQLWGVREADVIAGNTDKRMKEWPTFRMPFAKFVEAYPEGEVFVNDYLIEDMRAGFLQNPVVFVYDKIMDGIFDWAIEEQKNSDQPAFPTIEYFDERLANKQPVWGFDIDGDYVAYTEEFVREQGGVVNATVGGQAVVIAYDEQFDSLGVFYNPAGKQIGQIDFWGVTELGKLERVESVKAGAFWVVWANFFPQTDVNRV